MTKAIAYGVKWFVPNPGTLTVLFPYNGTDDYGEPACKLSTYDITGRYMKDMSLGGFYQTDSKGRKCFPFQNVIFAFIKGELYAARKPDLEGWVKVTDGIDIVGGVEWLPNPLLPCESGVVA